MIDYCVQNGSFAMFRQCNSQNLLIELQNEQYIMELIMPAAKSNSSDRHSFSMPRASMLKKVTMTQNLRAQHTSFLQRRKKFSLTPLLLSKNPVPKFKSIQFKESNSSHNLSFQKWKTKNIMHITPRYCQKLKQQFTKQHMQSKQNKWIKEDKVGALKRQIRQLTKLKEEVGRAKRNNELMKQIENFSEEKIKRFFEEFQGYVNLMSK